ncbi:fused 4'-phosphopantothenoylcysteine decarboxylase; phosphopantothenoylcysteine synthetase,FMN-binding [Beijerinckiaceae bacterium RH AL1]|nr:fused 4'-phosphopantothenoylcysteine decarboxylase; phosphopantothenoylcysteine synthetase,FMN-binding [Beijerinckiaceae bacterium RH AL8]VVB42408.1 fused 4'-phosphopantothenoylcysteine decarboxylase; phosphopantothenoylcysteine synthetase,FMN-binding [Beijerinckiaceae bacterium RH CH11]VVC53294.1 fused 4'-phosphopantothenoylcysteine decarboxylase; phosphopantothenoylcysteine synthetase,FMN-binding [Beijerinckiaceae bacterium RH AL1]
MSVAALARVADRSVSLTNKTILLVVGGGIAAYKALDLVRRLRERGVRVRPVLTAAAKQFVTPLSFASLAGETVHDELFSLTDEAEMGHIELSRAADLIVVAPATANLIARMANGLADDLATTLLLATDKRALLAPAMNLRMWLHPATQRNVATLRSDGVLFCGPDDGAMACGEYGPGRMAEPLAIVAAIEAALGSDTRLPLPGGALAGRRVVVTSGPTHEPIDPVRFIANRSSGKQGHALAAAAAAAGADVVLVSGPVALADPQGVAVRRVETAREMLAAVEAALPADIFVAAAAVADWRVAEQAPAKLKKNGKGPPALALAENPDILATIARRNADRPKLVVGFAAETDDLVAHARAKLEKKGCDLIVLNDVGAASGTFGGETNEVTLVEAAGETAWPRLDKVEVAGRLMRLFGDKLGAKA